MIRKYCTLFDKNYLKRGMVLIDTLTQYSSDNIDISVLALDQETRDTLWSIYADSIEIDFIDDLLLKDEELRKAKANRTHQEFCWTLASYYTNYLLRTMDYLEVTYLDSDVFILSDPEPVFMEIGTKSIAITPHRLIPEKKHLEVNGIFNVGWVTFRADSFGLACASIWAAQCLEWCYNAVEPTRFGDQKYLDYWPTRFGENCHIIEHIGCNLAPWNLANYRITDQNGELYVGDKPIVAFHTHEFKEMPDNTYRLTNYILRVEDYLIYDKYIALIERASKTINEVKGC